MRRLLLALACALGLALAASPAAAQLAALSVHGEHIAASSTSHVSAAANGGNTCAVGQGAVATVNEATNVTAPSAFANSGTNNTWTAGTLTRTSNGDSMSFSAVLTQPLTAGVTTFSWTGPTATDAFITVACLPSGTALDRQDTASGPGTGPPTITTGAPTTPPVYTVLTFFDNNWTGFTGFTGCTPLNTGLNGAWGLRTCWTTGSAAVTASSNIVAGNWSVVTRMVNYGAAPTSHKNLLLLGVGQ